MNMGHEEEELLPYKEPTLDISDQKRIEILIGMGYPRVEVEESLRLHKFDDCYASYLLLGRKSTDVESDGSRSGSSLSLRNMSGATNNAAGGGSHTAGGGTSGAGGTSSQSPSHGNSSNSGSGSTSHNRVQRSISATSSKPRRGSTGPPPSAAPRVNNNVQSNFKRQNTVDTATIKENTPRYSGSRPATATAVTSKTSSSQQGGVTSPKSRGITKSNTMSNATGRAALGQPVIDKRRSAYDGKISTSTDKTNQLDSDALKLPLSPTGRGSSAAAQSFSRNVPERSTFHSGMTRNRTRAPYAGIPTSSQDTSALNSSRPSTFFSKLSSKFSKRPFEEGGQRGPPGQSPGQSSP